MCFNYIKYNLVNIEKVLIFKKENKYIKLKRSKHFLIVYKFKMNII